ncbi:unnamed protein product [Miscanthus lutarioriparius]|uniref:Dirigent protein n=1 Tax=Miscanthus lutarioriparius TaxID=422564 RepID=A0A811S8P9_9POAL|nr:unnamed protein product [Miscanthus lutarioriparius]
MGPAGASAPRPEPHGRADCSNKHDWVIGRAQGFYVASSQDGTSKTIVLTAMLEGPEAPHGGDTLSFFGVHRMAAPESHIAIIGGTGKYEHAKGFAAIQTLHPGDEHTIDGSECWCRSDGQRRSRWRGRGATTC